MFKRIIFLCFFVCVYSDKKEHRIAVEDVKNIYVCKPAPFSVIEKIWVSHLSIMKCDDSLLPIWILHEFANGTKEYMRAYLSDRNGCLELAQIKGTSCSRIKRLIQFFNLFSIINKIYLNIFY